MSNELQIAISGKSGCGNTTTSRLVAARLGLRVVNYTFKDLARDRGVSFDEICRLAETDPQYDRTIDNMQIELAEKGDCVLGSRLAIWLLRQAAVTVYLYASLEVRAGRIAHREGWTLEKAMIHTETRDKRDHDRYLRLYGYDVDTFDFADFVLNVETLNQDEVARAVVQHVAGAAGQP